MKTLFDDSTRDALIKRIRALNENATPLWGTMDLYQMMTHCSTWDEMVQSNKPLKRSLIGRLLGPIVLRRVLKDEAPLKRNTPTSPHIKIKSTGDVRAAKAKWLSTMENYAGYDNPEFLHDFFGRMTREQVGQLGYKHVDHHLRQFGG